MCDWSAIFLEMVKGLPTALVTLAIGSVATYVAYRQYLTSHAKLKLDLFNKRYEIFEQTWKYLSIQDPDERPSNFTNYFHQAKFLFGTDVELYMHTIKNRTDEWSRLKKQKESHNHLQSNIDTQLIEIENWFASQLRDEISKIFFPYLSFEKWK